LFNIEVTPDTVPDIVRCVRDPDNINRKVVYLRPLSNMTDFRMLNFEQKYEVLKWGLNDRNELVQKEAYKMFSDKWIVQANNNLLEFLERLEATKPAMSVLAEQLLERFFQDNNEVANEIDFDGKCKSFFFCHVSLFGLFL
jgi:condensin complex subunit 3